MQQALALDGETRPISVVYGRDHVVLPLLFQVHAPDATDVLDCTYNRGVMWKKSGHAPTVTVDLDPDMPADHAADFRDMPFDDNSFDVVVFDPPHLPAAVASKGSSGIEHMQYGLGGDHDYRQGDNISPAFVGFAAEAQRVLRPGGVVFAKIADLVHNHRYQWQHVDFIVAAQLAGMSPCDVIVKADPAAANLKSSKWRNVKHFRRAHCYWIVVRNGRSCEYKH